ncbi:MAG TPA: AAA family ATPase [Thermomicrobiales bacterium]|nr:AAA family ATPase [Thermomicrobiales bacterium]
MTSVMRVHIVGGPGSGKTTLTRSLARECSLPLCELDTVAYEHGAGAKRSLDLRLADVVAVSRQDTWITEGIFLGWTDELFDRADAIIWLDLPWHLAAWRILLRHARASRVGANPHQGLRRLGPFLLDARRYYRAPANVAAAPDDDRAVTRDATANLLARYRRKTIHCRSRQDVEAAMRSIAARCGG